MKNSVTFFPVNAVYVNLGTLWTQCVSEICALNAGMVQF